MIRKWKPLLQAGHRLAQGAIATPEAIYKRCGVRSFWGFKNFGDLMTPYILEKIGKVPINCPTPRYAEFLGVGSILDPVNKKFSGYIVGSGFLRDGSLNPLPEAKILCVRGQLTKKRLGITCTIPLGDLGLIFPDFCSFSSKKTYELGVIAHYLDVNFEPFVQLRKSLGETVKFINVMAPPDRVLQEIASCQNIVSSSLHGLVIADSLGISNAWICVDARQSFKYHDYYSALDERATSYEIKGTESLEDLVSLTRSPPMSIKKVKTDLRVAIETFQAKSL